MGSSNLSSITESLENYIIVQDGEIKDSKLGENFTALELKTSKDIEQKDLQLFLNQKNDLQQTNQDLLIQVPRNKVFKDTLHVFYIQTKNSDQQNTYIILEESSEFTYFEYLYGFENPDFHFTSLTYVSENAKCTYAGLTNISTETSLLNRIAYVNRYGSIEQSIAEIGSANTVSMTQIDLLEQYASGTSKTVAITNEKQSSTYKQTITHYARETEGYIENYGVANDESKLLFEGTGSIKKGQKRSVARQKNRGIVLGEEAELNANPLLLIDEYDVEASHGAAIGKIDDEQLYYLMSRGLTLKHATRLIISGFLSPVLKHLDTEALTDNFIQAVEQKTM